MKIEDLTIKQARELAGMFGGVQTMGKRLPMLVGEHVFIMTVTHYYTGRVVACTEEEVQLGEAAWIADTGRFADFVAGKHASEVEPFPDSKKPVLNRSAFVAWCAGPDELPRNQK